MRIISCVLGVGVVILGVLFGALNATRVPINYYVHTSYVFLPLLLMIALASGALLAGIAVLRSIWRYRRINRQLSKKVRLLQQQLLALEDSSNLRERNLPG